MEKWAAAEGSFAGRNNTHGMPVLSLVFMWSSIRVNPAPRSSCFSLLFFPPSDTCSLYSVPSLCLAFVGLCWELGQANALGQKQCFCVQEQHLLNQHIWQRNFKTTISWMWVRVSCQVKSLRRFKEQSGKQLSWQWPPERRGTAVSRGRLLHLKCSHNKYLIDNLTSFPSPFSFPAVSLSKWQETASIFKD